jgi:hypothetical protein
MWSTMVVLKLLAVWAGIFLIALLPAVWIARWLAPPTRFLGFVTSVALTKMFVVLTASLLIFAQFESLPHVTSDRPGFSIFFTTIVFGVPAFGALLVGVGCARRRNTVARA